MHRKGILLSASTADSKSIRSSSLLAQESVFYLNGFYRAQGVEFKLDLVKNNEAIVITAVVWVCEGFLKALHTHPQTIIQTFVN